MRTPGRLVLAVTMAAVSAGWGIARGQAAAPPADSNPNGVQQSPPTEAKPNPLKRRLNDREKIDQQKQLKQELKGEYKKWLDEDVLWIITDTERQAFKNLSNDEEREAFIENFWRRRNPAPDSPDNEYRDEIYARIAYANDHFAAGKPGYLTDRGHIYIAWGKPDDIDSHPSGGLYTRPNEEGGGQTASFPFEIWHYRYLEGIGENVTMEFVDSCQCGDYHYTIDRSEKDALKYVPGAGLTDWEASGQSSKADRFNGNALEQLGKGPFTGTNDSKEFDRLDTMSKILAPPPIKFQDLEDFMVTSKVLRGPPLLFDVRTDYVKVTNETVNVPITIQLRNSDITFDTKDGVSTAKLEIQGWVSNMTHHIVQTFGDPVEISTPSELLAAAQKGYRVYWKSLYLNPGLYKVDIVIKDVNNTDHIGRWTRSLNVPQYDDDTLGHSSLILADEMFHVPSKEIGAGTFVIGDTHVRPKVAVGGTVTPPKFARSQNLNFWMQVYNLGIDDKTKQNNATVDYTITDAASNKVVLEKKESTTQLNANAEQLTLEKTMSLASLQPGQYTVSIKVDDAVSKEHTEESAKFAVE
jgi:GWxTD domain-containing protein